MTKEIKKIRIITAITLLLLVAIFSVCNNRVETKNMSNVTVITGIRG